MSTYKLVCIVVLLVLAVLGYSSVYIVSEGQQALLLRLGSIEKNAQTGAPCIAGPGLHWKWPLITWVKIFDTRLQTFNIKSSRIVTAEQKDVIVDYYVKWRIVNPTQYFISTGGDAHQAGVLLEQQLNDGLRAQFGRRTITDVIADDRTTIMDTLDRQANASAQKLGLAVIDVRIKRIDLPSEMSNAVFERMRAERERIAAEHRATGKSNAETIRAKADADVTITIATAKAQAAAIRGQGDAEAAKIYADAYDKDSAFFAFWRSLQAYKNVFANAQNTVLVLRPDSQFFRYFNSDKSAVEQP